MPKIKTNSAAKKRFRKTGGGKVKRACSMRRHILTKKTRKRKRNLRKGAYICKANERAIKQLLPN